MEDSWNDGTSEYWITGRLEYWETGEILGFWITIKDPLFVAFIPVRKIKNMAFHSSHKKSSFDQAQAQAEDSLHSKVHR